MYKYILFATRLLYLYFVCSSVKQFFFKDKIFVNWEKSFAITTGYGCKVVM